MAKDYKVIYLDSCVILDCLIKSPPHYHHVAPILTEAESGKLKIIASVLCLAEVLKVGELESDDTVALIDSFFNSEYVNLYAVSLSTARETAKIRKRFPLDTADAIHLATALESNAEAFITRDGEGKKGRRGKKTTLLELRSAYSNRIDILTPKDFFESLSSETKQTSISAADSYEE